MTIILSILSTIVLALVAAVVLLYRRLADCAKDVALTENRLSDRLTDLHFRLAGDGEKWRIQVAELNEKLEKAESLIESHAELEAEAVKSERLFQEGLTNLLNYGVK